MNIKFAVVPVINDLWKPPSVRLQSCNGSVEACFNCHCVSTVIVFWKWLTLFVRIRSIVLGLSDLENFGSLTMFLSYRIPINCWCFRHFLLYQNHPEGWSFRVTIWSDLMILLPLGESTTPWEGARYIFARRHFLLLRLISMKPHSILSGSW